MINVFHLKLNILEICFRSIQFLSFLLFFFEFLAIYCAHRCATRCFSSVPTTDETNSIAHTHIKAPIIVHLRVCECVCYRVCQCVWHKVLQYSSNFVICGIYETHTMCSCRFIFRKNEEKKNSIFLLYIFLSFVCAASSRCLSRNKHAQPKNTFTSNYWKFICFCAFIIIEDIHITLIHIHLCLHLHVNNIFHTYTY